MDRTIIVPYRAEEKELSHLLYNAIQGLTLLYPPTEDLKKCLSDEMFIKPNQQAFFHVMHYLFRLLDAQEFKKRFFWPITDKRSESNFRTSTVEYLKYINEKYQLNWTNIKSYLVVMPGGMKFISFLLDFVNFIVQELIKQKEKQLNLDSNHYRDQVSEANLHKICARDVILKGMASEFLDAIDSLNTKYDENSQKLMERLEILSQETGLSVDLLTDDKFLEDFKANNYHLFEQHYSNRTQKVLKMESLIRELKEAMDKFYSKETGYKYDKQRICLQLRRIREQFPIEELVEESFGSKVTDEGVNINTLISTFNAINHTIQNELKTINKRPCAGEFVYSRLLNLKKDLQEIETQITEFQKMLHTNMKKTKTEFPQTPIRAVLCSPTKCNLENNLLMKLVSTPPIKFEIPEGGGKSRLSLVDSKSVNTNETTLNFLAPPRTAIRQFNRHNNSVDQSMSDLNNTINRSKIIDPIQLLRSTSKKEPSKYKTVTPQTNISNLGSMWKQRQSLFNDNDDEKFTAPILKTPIINTPNTHNKRTNIRKTSPQSVATLTSPTILHQSPFTPFSSNDRTRIAKSQFHNDSGGLDAAVNNSSSTLLNYVRKLSAVKKVQDASVNLTNLSTSPSGRLEPLVTVEDFDIPKLKLNDMSLIDHNLSINNCLTSEKPKIIVNSPPVNSIDANNENNSNTINIRKEALNDSTNIFEQEEDALFNISDSVLKDVTL